jgi:hypothetical protein
VARENVLVRRTGSVHIHSVVALWSERHLGCTETLTLCPVYPCSHTPLNQVEKPRSGWISGNQPASARHTTWVFAFAPLIFSAQWSQFRYLSKRWRSQAIPPQRRKERGRSCVHSHATGTAAAHHHTRGCLHTTNGEQVRNHRVENRAAAQPHCDVGRDLRGVVRDRRGLLRTRTYHNCMSK